jgi:hypothetical protein
VSLLSAVRAWANCSLGSVFRSLLDGQPAFGGAGLTGLTTVRDRWRDPGLRAAARTGALVGLWLAGLGMIGFLVWGGAHLGLDSHAYWLALRLEHPYSLEPHDVDAYLYSPLFLQVLYPLGQLPWPAFVVVWAAMQAGIVWWLLLPLRAAWRIPVLLLCSPEFVLGNVHALMALSLVSGFIRPGWWAFLALTKVEPAAPVVLWLAFRGEWRRLVGFSAWSLGLPAVSALAAPRLWSEWIAFLTREHDFDAALWVCLGLAVALVAVAAPRGWVWALPIAVLLAIPTDGLGVSGIVLMTALPRLQRHLTRCTPAHPRPCMTDDALD